MQIAGDEAKGHRLIGGSLNLARTEYPGCIPIEQQAQQHFGSVGFPTACSILGIQRREVQLSHTVYHKASEMARGQAVAQPHCQFQRLLIVHCFESSTHAHQYTITGQCYLLLSDKLLEDGTRKVAYRKTRQEAHKALQPMLRDQEQGMLATGPQQ